MTHQLKLMAVLAHPDDESLGFGGTLARYSAEEVETYLVTATRGERGRFFSPDRKAEPAEVGRVRQAELQAAAAVLGIREVFNLGYPDGAVDQIDAATAIAAIARHIRRVRPHVVVTFGPDGAYGHPDHIAISQFTAAAIVCASDAGYDPRDGSAGDRSSVHRVAKLYNLAWRKDKWDTYQAAFRKLTSMVDGVARQANPWPDWAVTTEIDTTPYWSVVWKAVSCHHSQMSMYERLEQLSEARQQALWGSQEFYRVHSAVNGGRKLENDLFEGLR